MPSGVGVLLKVRSNCPVSLALIRKYVDRSIGQRMPFGDVGETRDHAEFEPWRRSCRSRGRHCQGRGTSSGRAPRRRGREDDGRVMCSCSLNVAATETLLEHGVDGGSYSSFCSSSGIPSFSNVRRIRIDPCPGFAGGALLRCGVVDDVLVSRSGCFHVGPGRFGHGQPP